MSTTTSGGTPQDQMYRGIFKDYLEKFNRVVVQPAQKEFKRGKYRWPIGDYSLEVTFSDEPGADLIPFNISRPTYGAVSTGCFHVEKLIVEGITWPAVEHINNLCGALDLMLKDSVDPADPVPQSENSYHQAPPAMLMNDFTDLSDEWVEWYRKRNPGASYAKAVHTGMGLIRQESKKLRTLVDKYTHNN